jgi:plastocyanin
MPMKTDRRRLLRLGGLAMAGALAGCSQGEQSQQTTTSGGTTTPQPAQETDSGGTSSGTPGADQLGGPDALQSSATVDATVLSSDQGAGRNVFTPAVVWVEQSATVTWTVSEGSHSITAYHPDNDKPQRVPDGAAAFDSGVLSSGETFEHTFETQGVHNYYCTPHEGLGMVGLVVVDSPQGGPGTTEPSDVSSGAAADGLSRLLSVAGLGSGGGESEQSYGWEGATWDSYWYSLYNMSTNIAMSGNGILFPHNDQQRQQFQQRIQGITQAADVDQPPIRNPNLNMAPFTTGDPHFTQQPDFGGENGRPDADTLAWDQSQSSGIVSPSSVAWTHLKGVTWAKNFEDHFDLLPQSIAPKFRAQVLTTLAQLGVKGTLIDGGPQNNGLLTAGDDTLQLLSGVRPAGPAVTDRQPRVRHHSAMLWFLSDLVSLAQGGWFGYENPEPLIPAENIQQLTDGMFQATSSQFPASSVSNTRELGQLLGAVGWYGTHAGNSQRQSSAVDYADALASQVESNLAGNGQVQNGAANQAATQGVVGQGLLWASEIDGVDHTDTAEDVLGYLLDTLWDGDASTFAPGEGASTYTITARDAGDITGGLNAADAVLGMNGVRDTYAQFFDATFNRGGLQRAQRPPSVDDTEDPVPPLPPMAGGEFGQAAVYNAEIEYDTDAGEWSVTDDTFDTEAALYLANQDIWIGQWGGDMYQGRGRPGHSDTPPGN